MWRSTIRRNCRYFFISALGFGPRFRPSGFAPPPPSGIQLEYPGTGTMETGVAQLHSIAQIRITCSMFKLLFIANATRSRSTLRRNMVEYQHSRGPKPRAEIPKSRIVAKIRTPFRPSGESTFPYSANFRDFMSNFGPRCKFFLREVLEANLGKL